MIVAVVAVVTDRVETVKFTVVALAGTVTLAETVAEVLLDVSVTTAPPGGAAAERVTVPVDGDPPVTDVGLS